MVPHQSPPPPASLPAVEGPPKAPFSPGLLGLLIRPLRQRPGHLLPIPPSPKPVIQLSLRHLYPKRLRTPPHCFSNRPKSTLRYRLPQLSLLLHRPGLAMRLPIALLMAGHFRYPSRLVLPNPPLNRPVYHPHHRLHPNQPLPSPQHPQCLPSPG